MMERILALAGGVVVGGTSLVALKNDWKTTGIENHVTKLMLGLMAFGCVLAILASLHILGHAE